MEEEATCSICFEHFKDPVSLPCGHGFCRNCLKTLIDHSSGTKTDDNTSSDQEIFSCPLCREEVKLSAGGVDDLSPSQSLAELAEKCRVTQDSTTTVPPCDMCEGDKSNAYKYCVNCAALYCRECLDALHPQRGPFGRHRLISMEDYLSQKSTQTTVDLTVSRPLCDMCESDKQRAANFCVSCMALYCQQCLSAFHPQRGPFGRHQLLSVEEYLSQKSHEAAVSSGETGRQVVNCGDHKEPLILFCGTCEQPICTECISQHENHAMQNISTAYSKRKAPMEDKIQNSREMKSNLLEMQTQLIAAQKDVKTKMDHEMEQIDVTYEGCLKDLSDWRTSERSRVEEKKDTLTKEALTILKQINQRIEETDLLITTSVQLLSGAEALFLKDSADLASRIQSNTDNSTRELEDQKLQLSELRSTMNQFEYSPCALTITGRSPLADISFPRLRFTDATEPNDVSVVDGGAEVVEKDNSDLCPCVRTNGLVVMVQYYWQVTMTWGVSSPPESDNWWVVGSVGVQQKGTENLSRPGIDPLSYGVEICYCRKTQQHSIYCVHREEEEYISTPQSYKEGLVTQTLGFLLDVSRKTLTVVDVDGGKVLYTFRNIQILQPLVPVVFFGSNYFHKSFRLLRCDPSSLPQPVRAILQSKP